jgi:hypothetical protein
VVSPGGEEQTYPPLRNLDERPVDGSDRAVRAITELVELARAGQFQRANLLRDVLEELRRVVIDATYHGYFADAALSTESVAGLLAGYVVRANQGLRVPEPGALALARVLRFAARHQSLSRSAVDRVSFAASAALGPGDPREELVRKHAVLTLEGYFQEAIDQDVASGDDLDTISFNMAATFYKVHDSGFRVGDARALARKLKPVIERDGDKASARKLLKICARHVGIEERALFNFKVRKAKRTNR